MVFIDLYTHLYKVVKPQLSYIVGTGSQTISSRNEALCLNIALPLYRLSHHSWIEEKLLYSKQIITQPGTEISLLLAAT